MKVKEIYIFEFHSSIIRIMSHAILNYDEMLEKITLPVNEGMVKRVISISEDKMISKHLQHSLYLSTKHVLAEANSTVLN